MPRPMASSSARHALIFALSCIAQSCAPATQAAFVPQLYLGLRSSRVHGALDSLPSERAKQGWDVAVFANLSWTSQRSAALIPSRQELSPDAWIDPCPDQDCFWDAPEDSADTTLSAVDGSP